MSFYTALTGLNGAQADISATSNNIANVGTTGFKRSRAEFGDIFATSPLQNASSSIGSGTILKGIKQQFTQGNIASSLNALWRRSRHQLRAMVSSAMFRLLKTMHPQLLKQ
jgi:flagellar hook protein FlgE